MSEHVSPDFQRRLDRLAEHTCKRFEPVANLGSVAVGECDETEEPDHHFVFNAVQHDIEDIGWPAEA